MKTILIFCCALALLLAAPASGVESQKLRGHVPEAVARLQLQPLGRLPATNRLHLAIGLPLRNTNELARLLEEIYDPASPQFRHYLTPEQFTARFGPTEADYEAVRQFALKSGLEVTVTNLNRVVLDVAAPVADIERVFQISLGTYQHPTEARKFYAPDVEPSIGVGLTVLGISGLNNYSVPHPAFHATSRPYARRPGTGSGPRGTFMGKDLRNAYAPGVTLTGTGQSVGLLAFEAFYLPDVIAYEKMAGLPNVPIQVVLLDGFNGINTDPTAGGEANLDIDMAISIAPGLSNVVVFDAGPNGNLVDVLSAMASRPQIKQFSSSWIYWSTDQGTISTSDNLLKQMTVQGQSFFEASGDGDAWYNNPISDAPWLADDPYVISVGGTSLTMNGAGASYGSETVWNYGFEPPGWAGSVYVGSGGGMSIRYALPSWQQGLDLSASRGSRTRRNFPDVAMSADNYVIVFQGTPLTGWWGTSFAAPLWAGYTALANQQAVANGRPAVGFFNPALYALGQSVDYTNSLHDITLGNNAANSSAGLFPAVPGYDLGTGWGSPKDSHLIQALALPERLVITPNTNLVITGPVGGPFAPAGVTYGLTNRTGSLDWGLGLDADWLSLAPTHGTHLAGTPSAVVSIVPNLLASNLVAGSYTATLFFTNLMDQSVQSRQVTLAVARLPEIIAQPTNQVVPQGVTAVFSVGTAPSAMLTYNGSSTMAAVWRTWPTLSAFQVQRPAV
jgi:subtilase family serine protease